MISQAFLVKERKMGNKKFHCLKKIVEVTCRVIVTTVELGFILFTVTNLISSKESVCLTVFYWSGFIATTILARSPLLS